MAWLPRRLAAMTLLAACSCAPMPVAASPERVSHGWSTPNTPIPGHTHPGPGGRQIADARVR